MMGFGRSANYALWSPSALTVHRTVIHSLLCSNPELCGACVPTFPVSLGGDDGIRTHDPLLAGQVLSQLSYTPIKGSSLFFTILPLLEVSLLTFLFKESKW